MFFNSAHQSIFTLTDHTDYFIPIDRYGPILVVPGDHWWHEAGLSGGVAWRAATSGDYDGRLRRRIGLRHSVPSSVKF